jgi:GTP diphosphokinase / guanosine-3',5'-bis(diphosphate) 3'-diphosphatase
MDGFSYEDFSRFVSALMFCAEKHRNQRRKDAVQTPYLNHPIEVAEMLWNVGKVREMPVLIAALLHDVIEDTETGPEEIGSRFGDEVLSLVLEVTDDKRLPRSERKEMQVLHAPDLSRGAKLIKIADKIGNVRDVTWSPPPDWSIQRRIEYLEWAERIVKGLGIGNGELVDLFYKVLAEGEAELGAR